MIYLDIVSQSFINFYGVRRLGSLKNIDAFLMLLSPRYSITTCSIPLIKHTMALSVCHISLVHIIYYNQIISMLANILHACQKVARGIKNDLF